MPAGKVIHAIVDNYATHKHPQVRKWLTRHPRWTFHFTPSSASWLNAVEGFFAKLTRRRLKRGVFCSVVDLQAAINRFLAETNSNPKPFVWTADPQRVLAAVKRGKEALESLTSSLSGAFDRCIAARMACVVVALPWSICPITSPGMQDHVLIGRANGVTERQDAAAEMS